MEHLMRSMRRHPLLSGAVLAGIIALGILAVRSIADAPAISDVMVADCGRTDGGACARFPAVTGTNLLGETVTLPDNPAGLTLVLLPFDERQTARAAAWLPLARSLASEYPGFAYYNAPVLRAVNPLARAAIIGGMVIAVPQDVHAVTVMLFLEDKQLFLDTLGIHETDVPQALLLDAAGVIIWRRQGDYSDEAASELRAALSMAADTALPRS